MNSGEKNYFRRAISLYECAEKIEEHLVFRKGNKDRENDLANTYIGQGLALDSQGKLAEAIIEYERSIQIYERLVNEENREDLANDLAMAYWGKGNVLADLDRLDKANEIFGEAIRLWDRCLQRNELHILPNLFTVLYLRVEVLIKQENWNLVAEDTRRALNLRDDASKYADFSKHFKNKISNELNDIIQLIRAVSIKNRETIYKHAGEDGERVRQLVDDI